MKLTHVRQLFWAGEVWRICEVSRKIRCCLNKIITWIIAFRIILEREREKLQPKDCLLLCSWYEMCHHHCVKTTICNLQQYLKAIIYKELEKSKIQLPWLLSHSPFTAARRDLSAWFPQGEPGTSLGSGKAWSVRTHRAGPFATVREQVLPPFPQLSHFERGSESTPGAPRQYQAAQGVLDSHRATEHCFHIHRAEGGSNVFSPPHTWETAIYPLNWLL